MSAVCELGWMGNSIPHEAECLAPLTQELAEHWANIFRDRWRLSAQAICLSERIRGYVEPAPDAGQWAVALGDGPPALRTARECRIVKEALHHLANARQALLREGR